MALPKIFALKANMEAEFSSKKANITNSSRVLSYGDTEEA